MARKRILIVKLSSLGDLFHALPAVHRLKTGLDADIDWVTQPEYVDLLACFPDVSAAIPFPRRSFVTGLVPFLRRLRACRYDWIIDLQGLLKSAVAARLARGGRVIGPSFHREGSRWLYDAVAGPRDKDRHAVEENLDVVRHLGLPDRPVEFPVRFPPHAAAGPGPRIAVVPVSRGPEKNWPLVHFTEAVRRLRDATGAAIALFGSPADRLACETVRAGAGTGASLPTVENLAGRTTLVEMGSRFATMDLVVANDSGPIHLAAAIGVPVLAVFGPTDPRRTGPYGSGHRVITAEVECRPCHRAGCRRERLDCLEQIGPERVVREAIAMLGARKA